MVRWWQSGRTRKVRGKNDWQRSKLWYVPLHIHEWLTSESLQCNIRCSFLDCIKIALYSDAELVIKKKLLKSWIFGFLLNILFISLVMGHVIKNGLDTLGTGRSYYLDKDFQSEVQTMMDLGKSPSTLPREKKHINAVKLWAQGCVSAYKQHQRWYLILCFVRRSRNINEHN